MLFLHPIDAPEAAAGHAARFLRRKTVGEGIALGQLQVRPDLAVQFALEPPGADEREQAANEQPRGHGLASRNLATSAVARSQFATSTRSWRVPAAVKE